MSSKTCPQCKRTLNETKFSLDKYARSGLSSWCKECISERERTRGRKHRRKHKLKTRYGLTVETYDKMLREQSHRCAICGSQERQLHNATAKRTRLSVDHDHKTGKVRGLLCAKCNRALGVFQDDPNIVHAAYQYLVQHKEETHGRENHERVYRKAGKAPDGDARKVS